MLAIIPEEAEELIPILRGIPEPFVHLILYAAPVTRRMLHFNRLNYYSLPSLPAGWTAPSWLAFEIGILAGRLYFEFSEYATLLDHLQSKNTKIGTLLDFVQEWLALRRPGQDIAYTAMGCLCQGLPLREDHPFFSTRKIGEKTGDLHRDLFPSTPYDVQSDEEDYYDDGGEEDMDFEAGMSNDEDSGNEEFEN